MTFQAMLIMALLITMNTAFGFYVYMRFGPKKLMMVVLPDSEYRVFEERLPPLSKLNPHGRKLALYGCLTIAVSLLILSELFRTL